MSMEKGQGMLLGQHTPVANSYSPELLYPIPRAAGREHLAITGSLPFSGFDLWHAYEMSWLNGAGKPVCFVGRFIIPASSPNMVESKSFKLYLNSLNNRRFEATEDARQLIQRDVAAVVGSGVDLQLLAVDDVSLVGVALAGVCLDGLEAGTAGAAPSADMLELQGAGHVQQMFYTHLLRSLCPVTGQPDWATVWLHYSGPPLVQASLLRYIIAYRDHQEFHEQCVERMFCHLQQRLAPEFLHIQAFYTRRGGLDINPLRSTDPAMAPLPRLNRQ